MKRAFCSVTCAVLVAGCTTYLPGSSFTGRDVCGTGRCISYIDFRDTGLFQEPTRVDELERKLATCGDKFVVLFVHGLQGSSREGSDYGENFGNLIETVIPAAQSHGFEVVGIYVGWRGQSWVLPALAPLTFGARRDAAKSVAHGQFPELLQRVTAARVRQNRACEKLPRVRVVAIGHSLGGLILFEGVWRDVVRRANDAHQQKTGLPLNISKDIDRIVLVNPAIAAVDYAPFYEGLKRLRFDSRQQPILETYAAKEDSVVGTWFAAFRRFETVTYDPSEGRELLTTPLSSVSQFVTHKLSSLSCRSDAATAVASPTPQPSPARVVLVEGVPEFQNHGDVWAISAKCITDTLERR